MGIREIIFRGKRADNGEWVCGGSIIRFNKEQGEDCDLVFMPQYDEKCLCTHDANDNIIAWDKTMFYKIDPSTVGQYTGQTDKNGKRIFEGDVVEYQEYGNLAVAWDDGAFQLMREDTFYDMLDHYTSGISTVVGNIHDNPELLEVSDNG